MQSDNFKNTAHLHFLVFIAGFTAILGELISIEAVPLVWYRMVMAVILIYIYIRIRKINLSISNKTLVKFLLAGVIIALHWITFFASINEANISIALAMFSTGAFFASLLEPLFFKRAINRYEILFGLLVILGVYLILDSEIQYLTGILLGISSALFSSLFAVINGTFIKKYNATCISFYEFLGGVLFISVYLALADKGFDRAFFNLGPQDWIYLFILASICTAYAFIAAVHVMKVISPFTVVLTYNLEPVYGILLAILIFGENEIMSTRFYYGAGLIFLTIVLNALVKYRAKKSIQ